MLSHDKEDNVEYFCNDVREMLDFIYEYCGKDIVFEIHIFSVDRVELLTIYKYFEKENEIGRDIVECNDFLDKNEVFDKNRFKSWLYEKRELKKRG